ncbi:MAG: hypothetical protein COT35_06675 [Nitrospirae bacterium CG08_land_8_20_14_0_20_52_24]|nr:MAG: hypothetical protein COT35_06675 [Nitrospirae bacterium CG08_land_8_20_14_0_20_52_24]PIV82441.1 MAG: hypothetical protein COW52_13600 [Nitrospirae bacterium CG17_big_fil_post_rev_8_21_14_2_50_50_9]PIX85895.1 MAG: hypothetical protein COZ32_06110 [Nitrospirae bacterium CG_4_10_14_3_um_filter_53_41]
MNRAVCISVFVFMVYPLISFGQEAKEINKPMENISGQYAECAAYYELVYHAMNSSNEKETADAYRQLQEKAMFYSLLLANEGRSKDLAIDVTNSRIEMYMKKMKQEANNRNENISILINKYHFGCQEAMKNPPVQVVEALNKAASDLSYTCEVIHVFSLTSDASLEFSAWEKDFKGSSFTVSRTDGKITGQVLPTLLAKSTRIINKGSKENSFKAVADFGDQYQVIEIQEFRKGEVKPFVASSMGGAGIVTGLCK